MRIYLFFHPPPNKINTFFFSSYHSPSFSSSKNTNTSTTNENPNTSPATKNITTSPATTKWPQIYHHYYPSPITTSTETTHCRHPHPRHRYHHHSSYHHFQTPFASHNHHRKFLFGWRSKDFGCLNFMMILVGWFFWWHWFVDKCADGDPSQPP